MIEQGLRTFLLASAPLVVLIGQRIYPQKSPQSVTETQARLTYFRVSTNRLGRSQDGPGLLARGRVQLDAWASDYLTAKSVIDAVRKAVDGYRGSMGAYIVQAAWLDDDRDEFVPPAHADDGGVYRTSADLMIDFVEQN